MVETRRHLRVHGVCVAERTSLRGEVTYAVPGSPAILEDTTNLIRLWAPKERVEVRVIDGVSLLSQALAEIRFDFSRGLQIVLPLTHLQHGRFTNRLGLLVCQIEAASLPQDAPRVDLTAKFLLQAYPPDHRVTAIESGRAQRSGSRLRRAEIFRQHLCSAGRVTRKP